MGGRVSLASWDPAENELVRRLVGLEPITDNDPFWNQLLSYNFKVDEWDRDESRRFEQITADSLDTLLYNTQTTANFAALVQVFLRRAREIGPSAQCDE